MKHKEHFAILDGLRGVAAIVVLLFHIVQQHDLTALPKAGFAVDFFYILSGFVVAYAYETRLATTLGVGAFMKVRLIRLYPLLFVGVSAGIGLAALSAIVTGFPTLGNLSLASILGLLLLPSFVFPQWPTAYPFNMAEWSLFFELWINLVYAVVARYLTTPRLIALVAVSGVCLLAMSLWLNGVHGGNDQGNWHYGFVRVTFPFFAGVLLCRTRNNAVFSNALTLGLIGAFSASLLLAIPSEGLADAAYIILLFPLMVGAGARLRAAGWLENASLFLGRISYPVYILQGPALRLGAEVKNRLHLEGFTYLFDALQFCGVVVISYLLLVYFDEPVRKYLSGKNRAQRTPVTT